MAVIGRAATSDLRSDGAVLCSVTVARRAGGRWSECGNESGAGNRRAFNPDILIASHTGSTFSLSMQLEFHQLELRWEHLRVRHPARQRRLLAALAESGQQAPIVVVAAEDQAGRYIVIDGYKRIAALTPGLCTHQVRVADGVAPLICNGPSVL